MARHSKSSLRDAASQSRLEYFLSSSLVTAGLIAAIFDVEGLERARQWLGAETAATDWLNLFLRLTGKNMALLLPIVGVAYVLDRINRRRSAAMLFLLLTIVMSMFLVGDSCLMAVNESHLLSYIAFIEAPDAIAWVGGPRAMAGSVTRVALLSILLAGVPAAIAIVGSRGSWYVDEKPIRSRRRALHGVLTAIAVGLTLWFQLDTTSASGALCRQWWPIPGNRPPRQLSQTLAAALDTLNDRTVHVRSDVAHIFQSSIEPRRSHALLRHHRTDHPQPHVVLVVVESWRSDALSPQLMPQLWHHSRKGLVAQAHYAGGNATQLGLFSLLYGQWSARYHPTLDSATPSGASRFFQTSGYDTTFVTSADHIGWARMDEFINRQAFDDMVLMLDGSWPQRDRAVVDHALQTLASAEVPQFIVLFISSTHYPYCYPPKFEQHLPVTSQYVDFLSLRPVDRPRLLNRYRNSLGFVDHLLGELIDRLALSETVVVVTGDHGESIFDDGTLTHVTLPSEAQLRVPLLFLGPGVEIARIDHVTHHADVLPTLIHMVTGANPEGSRFDGTSLLAPPYHRPVVITPMQPISHQPRFVLIKDGRMLQLRMDLNRGVFTHLARLGPGGRSLPDAAPTAREMLIWSNEIRSMVEPVP